MENQSIDQENSAEQLDNVADNAAQRTIAKSRNPEISLEETRNASEGSGPNGAGGESPSTAEEHVGSRSDEEASDLPSAR